jgi:hypothetical protein
MPDPTPSPERKGASVAQWMSESDAFRIFATSTDATESARHVKPIHWYVACRFVVEGGFHPDEITPRPPIQVVERRKQKQLLYAPDAAGGGEAAILGGLKTKNVDVVVMKDGIGPVVAVSCKGMTGALRNLTNRMEETIGETTNLHITYPALVFGYLFVLRATRGVEDVADQAAEAEADDEDVAQRRNDVAIGQSGSPVESLLRFDYALNGMTGRRSIRNEVSRYESVALALVDVDNEPGKILVEFPVPDSPIRLERFFTTMYARYEERFVFSAPKLGKTTRRHEWARSSPLFEVQPLKALGYEPRFAD